MIRIRCIHSAALPRDRHAVEQAQVIFRRNFAEVASYADRIPEMLEHPFRWGYRAVMLVSETLAGHVTGFALVLHFPEVNSSLLDYLAVERETRSGGLGGALYESAREYCQQIGSRGMYLEVLSDEPSLNRDPTQLQINRARMRFYERYGVRPIVGTDYEEPLGESKDPPPSLLFDSLGKGRSLRRSEARAAVRLILKRQYGHIAGPDYIERVVESFVDDPVQFRPPRYATRTETSRPVAPGRLERLFTVVCSTHHEIHHVQDRGYVERPARVPALLEAVRGTGLFGESPLKSFGEKPIVAVHDRDFVTYLRTVCEKLQPERPVYPYVFPIRRPQRRPRELAVRAGYYCIDTFTPLDRNAYVAARASVDVALTGAEEVLGGRPVAYALCSPPGHHAGRRTFGGFCYFSNAAIAAHRLAAEGKVGLLDIDYHHGNGTQEIFYARDDVLTLSIHGHPNEAYPYFSGFGDEIGEGPGSGLNRNYPLPDACGAGPFLHAVERAVARIERFAPTFLVVSLGFDTLRGDPTGSFDLRPSALGRVGERLAALDRATLVVQEGGYTLRNLRRGATAFFGGMAKTLAGGPPANHGTGRSS